jgi:hypothetical protein
LVVAATHDDDENDSTVRSLLDHAFGLRTPLYSSFARYQGATMKTGAIRSRPWTSTVGIIFSTTTTIKIHAKELYDDDGGGITRDSSIT